MAKMVNWNTAPFEKDFAKIGMDRLQSAAQLIANDAKTILSGKLKGGWPEHGPYETYKKKGEKGVMKPYEGGGPSWTARYRKEMINTIRVVRKYGDESSRNVRIYAGNYNTWWALQMEYGRGKWKGGAKSFLRPALMRAPETARAAIEGVHEAGALNTQGIGTYLNKVK